MIKRMLSSRVLLNQLFLLCLEWCPEPDLNRHDRNDRGILSPLCLPISPPGQGDEIEGGEAYHANAQSKAPKGQ